MSKMVVEVQKELETRILPFWEKLKDGENGGFYGWVGFDLKADPEAGKGGIATARQLWTFSAAYRVLGKEKYLALAEHAYRFLTEKVYDPEYKGLYWMVDCRGNPLDTRKHVYTQSFGIYALSEYYRITGKKEALDNALKLYELIESAGFDRERNAYKEEFTRDWREQKNEMLSEHGVTADVTTNTHLHVLEAYTNLYRVWKNKELKDRIFNLLTIFYEKIYDPDTNFLRVFFNKNWESLLDMNSYGHDIEASWLLDEAMKVTGIDEAEFRQMVVDIARNIAAHAVLKDGSLANEMVNGRIDETRVWWVQAEGAVGFFNAYERTGDERFKHLAEGLWTFIKNFLVDRRPGGEWFWAVDADGKPEEREIAGPWKCPYHNARFCLEMMERGGNK